MTQRQSSCTSGVTSLLVLVSCLLMTSEGNFGVNQTTTPTEVQPHLTKDLTVNCSIVVSNTSLVQLPLSLTIKKSTMRSPHNYTTVAFINSIEDKIGDLYKKNATISGHLATTGTGSYLAVHWLYPQFEMTGNYVCELLGFGGMGQAVTVNSTVKVTDHKPNQNDALVKLQEHDKKLAELEAALLTRGSTLDNFASAMFLHQQTVNNTRYMVSRPFLQNSAMAEAICHLYNGYLVEFDLAEYLNIKGVLRNASTSIYGYQLSSVMVGVTDEISEGVWRFRDHPKLSLPKFIHWGHTPQQPDGGRAENCCVLVATDDWKMADVPCYDNTAQVHFMCEAPVV